jgi:antitoxin YefM
MAIKEGIPIKEARSRLSEFANTLDGPVMITRRGSPVLAVMPWEAYEALYETLEIVSDRDLMKQLYESIREIEAGRTIPLENVEKELGL